ncbi:MAG: SRPBCC domain-containing protein [Leptospirales bacterium]|nr:SRPBCC domain-containing protein [Leptospirales bacterium]
MFRVTTPALSERLKDIEHEVTIRSTLPRVFDALTSSRVIDEWGGGPARVQARLNGRISLWDGEICGVIKEIEYPTRLVHTLREISWDENWLDSLVHWRLDETERGVRVRLLHTGLPNRRLREIHFEGWCEYFLGPMKSYLEG